jgi:hypothetical protein
VKPKDYIKAMTTGRWPPKEDEMPMSPGAERALMRTADLLPALIKSIEQLAKTNGELAHPVLIKCNHSVDLPLLVGLEVNEWETTLNALQAVALQVHDQGPQEGQSAQDKADEENKIRAIIARIRTVTGLK